MEKPIAFYPQLARELGDIASAIYYQQLYYWRDKGKRDDGWIYKSVKEIEEETTLTRKQQDRIRKNLLEKGWIEAKKKMANGAPTYHYRCLMMIDVVLTKVKFRSVPKGQNEVSQRDKSEVSQRDNSITENTREYNNVREFKTKQGKTITMETGATYKSDGFSPKDKLAMKKRLERSLGLNKTSKWSELLFGAAWDFLKIFKKRCGYDYPDVVLLDDVSKTLAKWYENGETRESIRGLLIQFFDSDKANKITITPKSVFSAHTYNSWKQNKLKINNNQNEWWKK